ncbi:hypothetical protein [Salinicoccus halodurans]|uniref:DUF4083 domain-containing protein n=1 Tax=Salinicoccus halodurans TaxID=407035 RepID=A0A0F7HJ00_9STAP|nr:hypothetical protein [Salinicoccus halodurans]AKG73309.1 hypothetical protein AAT16_03190 [Salinicoccus halodurans]SFK82586.1 hypothetical protein SAMN05216235_1884 [Salinicoccus halodurans]
MMEFLYFPEDKTEYIPAFLALAICILLAYIAFRIVKKYSRKQEEKMKAFEQQVLKRLDEEENDESRR